MLSCDCDDQPGRVSWYELEDPEPVSRRCCCSSCLCRIPRQTIAYAIARDRDPRNDIEILVYGLRVPMAPAHLCEVCGDIHLSLSALGYAADPWEDQRALLREYDKVFGHGSKHQPPAQSELRSKPIPPSPRQSEPSALAALQQPTHPGRTPRAC